jgi:predicted nuclease of restriction endonuclease-like RecB superfamily
MLTKQEVEYVWGARGTVMPGQIRKDQPAYVDYATALLSLFRDGIGKTRRDLERGVEEILETCDDCSLTRIRAFNKLLSAESYRDLGVPLIVYKSGIKLEPVLEALNHLDSTFTG